jgi:hypothetical protein
MLSKLSMLLFLIIGAAVTAVAWATLVPGSLSATTFGSILAVTIGLCGVSTIALRSSRPGPSVSQVLYETEHPIEASAQRVGAWGRNSTDAR